MLPLDCPVPVQQIAARLRRHGFEAWAVGGALRDALLGFPAVDWDLATNARPDQMREVFRRTVPIGVEHGTVGVLWNDGVLYEVTTYRRDVETDGRHAVVQFADSIDEDLARRDFTINALALDPATGAVRDPFDGRADLERGVIRTVGVATERFAEDWLRVLRALRFAGQLDFTIEPATWSAIQASVSKLNTLSAERVREELWKVLAKTTQASRTLDLYAKSGALAALYPELDRLRQLDAAGESDVWAHTLRALDAIPRHRTLLRVATLLHAVGMPAARARDLRGGYRYTGHEKMGARIAGELMRRLKSSNADTERVEALIARQSDLFPPDAPDAGVRRWLRDVGLENVADLFRMRIAKHRAETEGDDGRDIVMRWRHAHAVILAHPPLDVGALAIDGRDLKAKGLKPGPRFGELLHALLERVIEDPSLNERDRLLTLVDEALAE